MLGNFEYVNPTKLYFGPKALDYLQRELPKYGNKVVLIYGGGSIKKNGIYDSVTAILKANGKDVVEDAGVMPNPTSDKLTEGAKIAREHDADLWTATWAFNTLVAKGKRTDWMVHMLGQAMGAYTDATHGMTLAAVSLPYYRHIMKDGLPKFKRYAVNVWDVDPTGLSDEEAAAEGLNRMQAYMKEIGVIMHAAELGMTADMVEGVADATFILNGGYRELSRQEIVDILKESM